ncbi:MAG: hypothetical protein E7458_03010 [Ruminococcaceae bacterium]|nr:hypothetical protein [Oscillospiraceae bacterium]
MLIYWDRLRHFEKGPAPDDPIHFGMRKFRAALDRAGIRSTILRRDEFVGDESVRALVLTFAGFRAASTLPGESYQIRVRDQAIYLNASDRVGAMYGLLELAEIIDLEGYDAITDRDGTPFLEKRGIKFNWPYEPFGEGDPFEKNEKTVLDIEFWRDYIDFLAENRYNLLSIWSMNPFEMMFRVPKYPEATPYSDVELERFRTVFDFIFTHAKNRGIATYLITWNLRITPAIARGLGLPEQTAIPNSNRFRQGLRQQEPLIRDYFREAIKTLIRTYPNLTGLGTSNSEELIGNSAETEEWVADTYLKAIQELNVPLPFIHRTNMSNGQVAKRMFIEKYPGKDKLISWKYSNAHMYSHPRPQFEELWGAWKDMNVEESRVIYTVRNDDFQTLRGCDPEFIAEYIRGMKKSYVAGFYWGADGYVWAGDFQHVPHKHMEWKYDFERHFLQFATLGRLGYNPELPREHFLRVCLRRYGAVCGDLVLRGLELGVRTICAVTRLHWVDYDFQWHPESCMTTFGFHTVQHFIDTPAMPGSGTIGVMDTAKRILRGEENEAEDARRVIEIVGHNARELAEVAEALDQAIEPEYRGGDLACCLEDIRAWCLLSAYYEKKIRAALQLAVFQLSGDEEQKELAVRELSEAVKPWQRLAEVWAAHYMPYQMARVNQTFGYSYYTDEVRRDVTLAMRMKTLRELAENPSPLSEGGFESHPWALDLDTH